MRLKLSEIYYFESAKHYVKIKTLQEDYMVRAKMADLEQIFNEKGFVRVQSGYIVNLRHVDRVRYKDVLMNNGGVYFHQQGPSGRPEIKTPGIYPA